MPQSVMDLFPSLVEPGKRLVDAGELYQALNMLFSAQSGLVGTAAPGPVMTAAVNEVASGANVQLPVALAGRQTMIITVGALTVNAAASNPNNGGAADTVGGGASIAQAAGSAALYVCYAVGRWTQIAPAPAAPPLREGASSGTNHSRRAA